MTIDKIKKGAVVVLMTTSDDKKRAYKELAFRMGFNLLALDELGIANEKTPEESGTNVENAKEKLVAFLKMFKASSAVDPVEVVKNPLSNNYKNPEHLKQKDVWFMVEDSSFVFDLGDKELTEEFTKKAVELVSEHLSEEAMEILKPCLTSINGQDVGFPNVNYKDIVEKLPGGFPQFMDIIYKAQKEVGHTGHMKVNTTVHVAAANLKTGEVIEATEHVESLWMKEDHYRWLFDELKPGDALDTSSVQIPLNQPNNDSKSLQEILDDKPEYAKQIHYHRQTALDSITDIPKSARSSRVINRKQRKIELAVVRPEHLEGGDPEVNIKPSIFTDKANGDKMKISAIRDDKDLLKNSEHHVMDLADAFLLQPSDDDVANLELLTRFSIDAMTHPESMRKEIIVDNESGKFDKALKVFTEATKNGAHFGQFPFKVARTEDEKYSLIKLASRKLKRTFEIDRTQREFPESDIKRVPQDDIFTLAIFGGHANNSEQDVAKAKDLAYHAASQGWRIVTGGGIIDGPMGAAYTGFVQYHLDQLQEDIIDNGKIHYAERLGINKFITEPDGKYDAEKIIKNAPGLLEELAEEGKIPRDLFYAHSTDYLIKAESATKKPPAGITYYECGNIERRMDLGLIPGADAFDIEFGSIGTVQELNRVLRDTDKPVVMTERELKNYESTLDIHNIDIKGMKTKPDGTQVQRITVAKSNIDALNIEADNFYQRVRESKANDGELSLSA